MQRRILMTGASGLLGKYLASRLTAIGEEVVALRRGADSAGSLNWDAGVTPLNPDVVSGFDAVIHLSGEPVIGRWTQDKKKRIYDSRVRSTTALADAIADSALPPKIFICASAIGFYGTRNSGVVDETTAKGTGFLADVCCDWEEAAKRAAATSRVVSMRLGIVLSRHGGILGSLLPLYRLGLGGAPGDGTQYVSWMALCDIANAVEQALSTEKLRGPVNFVAPQPVTARELSDWMGKIAGRPAFLRQPSWLLRAAMGGEGANETVLSSLRVYPKCLLESGFKYACPNLPEQVSALDDAT